MTSRMASPVSLLNMKSSPTTDMLISPYAARAVPAATSSTDLEGKSKREAGQHGRGTEGTEKKVRGPSKVTWP